MDINDVTPEQATEVLQGMIEQDPVVAALTELFQRVAALEAVLLDVVVVVAEEAMNPAVMAKKLRSLLVPVDMEAEAAKPEAGIDTEWTPEDEAALNDAFKEG
jgi:hypothetical protein